MIQFYKLYRYIPLAFFDCLKKNPSTLHRTFPKKNVFRGLITWQCDIAEIMTTEIKLKLSWQTIVGTGIINFFPNYGTYRKLVREKLAKTSWLILRKFHELLVPTKVPTDDLFIDFKTEEDRNDCVELWKIMQKNSCLEEFTRLTRTTINDEWNFGKISCENSAGFNSRGTFCNKPSKLFASRMVWTQ